VVLAVEDRRDAPTLPISSLVSPVATNEPAVPVTWAKCPGPWNATLDSVTVATAPLAIRSTKLANWSAVTGCGSPASSARSLSKVAAPPATETISLPVQKRHRSTRCDPTAPRMPPPRDASSHHVHGAAVVCTRPSPRKYGRKTSSRCRTSPIAPARIRSRALRRLGS